MIALLVIGAAVVAFILGHYHGRRRVDAAYDVVEPMLAKLEAEMRARVTCSACGYSTPSRDTAIRQGWSDDPPRCFGCRTDAQEGPAS